MKTKEFIKRIEGLEFEVENGKEYYVIKDIDGEVIASINKLITFQICTDYKGWDELCHEIKKQLFDIISKYAGTPPDEREEEKKFYLKHKYFRHVNDKQYFTIYPYLEYPQLDYKLPSHNLVQTFTLKEIEVIKKKYNTDLSDFEKKEVKE